MRALIRNTGIALATVLLVGSCSFGSAVPTPQELAHALIDESDITIQALPEAQWDPYNDRAAWGPDATPGVVPESTRGTGLQVSLGGTGWEGKKHWVCLPHPLAEPAWQAYAEYHQTSPETPPVVEVGVRELIFAEDPSTVEDAFGQLRDSLTACLGAASAEASYETFEAPAVGDEQFALRASEKSWVIDGEQTYFHRSILVVRQGEVLVGVRAEVLSRESSQLVTQDDMSAIVTAAIDKLP